jgi:hypothetical protein
MSLFNGDVVQICRTGDTYKCCCVMLNNRDKCCYEETCDEYSKEKK